MIVDPRTMADTDRDLAPFFEALRDAPARELPLAFEARLLAQAEAWQAERALEARRGRGFGWVSGWLSALFPRPVAGFASLSLAAMLGLWIGLTETGPAAALTQAIWQQDLTVEANALLGGDWAEDAEVDPFALLHLFEN